jgi:hypothetical protein
LIIDSDFYFDAELSYKSVVTPKCDVHSFGVVVLEIVMGTYPTENSTAGWLLVCSERKVLLAGG